MKPGDLVICRNKLNPQKFALGIILTDERYKYSINTKFFNVIIDGMPRICSERHLELISSDELVST